VNCLREVFEIFLKFNKNLKQNLNEFERKREIHQQFILVHS